MKKARSEAVRDVTKMAREEVETALNKVFFARHDAWMAIFSEYAPCHRCAYPESLDMSEFERQLREQWQKLGGCDPHRVRSDWEDDPEPDSQYYDDYDDLAAELANALTGKDRAVGISLVQTHET